MYKFLLFWVLVLLVSGMDSDSDDDLIVDSFNIGVVGLLVVDVDLGVIDIAGLNVADLVVVLVSVVEIRGLVEAKGSVVAPSILSK